MLAVEKFSIIWCFTDEWKKKKLELNLGRLVSGIERWLYNRISSEFLIYIFYWAFVFKLSPNDVLLLIDRLLKARYIGLTLMHDI